MRKSIMLPDSGLFISLLLSVLLLLFACEPPGSRKAVRPPAAGTYYTCPMHPQIHESQAGKCPVCGMALIPAKDHPQPGDGTVRLTVPLRQQMLAGIRTEAAKAGPLRERVVLTGKVLFNPEAQHVASAPVSGWIKKMYTRNPGEKVVAGQKLYDLYSPDLLSAEKDYLLARQQKVFFTSSQALPAGEADLAATLRMMKEKLLRWGLSERQLARLPQERLSGSLTVRSRCSGYLIQKLKEEGDHVSEGTSVLSLADNRTLWVQARLYDRELTRLSEIRQIEVSIPGTGQRLSGKIAYDNPVNNKNSAVHLVTIRISNPGGRIQPDMLAYVYLQTGDTEQVLTIPRTAVLYGEKNEYTWVALGKGVFERRELKLGKANRSMIEVLQGIHLGESVVSGGAYLLNSEFILSHGSGINLSGMQFFDMQIKGESK